MRRPTQDDLLPASFELGCFVFVGAYAWFLACRLLLPPELRIISLIGPAVLLLIHLAFILLDGPFTGEGGRRLAWRLALTAALFLPLAIWSARG